MKGILLKAKNVKVNTLFRDPKTDILYIMKAFDLEENTVLAVNSAGQYWDCGGDYIVNALPKE